MESQKNVSTFVENENPTFTENQNSVSEFIPYELALDLKELGFDEPCFGEYKELECYDYKGGCGVKITKDVFLSTINGVRNYNQEGLISAPLYQQAFRFFREKYGYDYSIKPVYGEKHYRYYRVNIYVNEKLIQVMKYYFPDNPYFDNREEAELEALKKLIEIVKNK
jgi:hypothetical protein